MVKNLVSASQTHARRVFLPADRHVVAEEAVGDLLVALYAWHARPLHDRDGLVGVHEPREVFDPIEPGWDAPIEGGGGGSKTTLQWYKNKQFANTVFVQREIFYIFLFCFILYYFYFYFVLFYFILF